MTAHELGGGHPGTALAIEDQPKQSVVHDSLAFALSR
jgi:hypothetical protein